MGFGKNGFGRTGFGVFPSVQVVQPAYPAGHDLFDSANTPDYRQTTVELDTYRVHLDEEGLIDASRSTVEIYQGES